MGIGGLSRAESWEKQSLSPFRTFRIFWRSYVLLFQKILIALRKSESLLESLGHIEIFELSRTLKKSQPNHCIESLFQIRIIPCSLFQTFAHRIHVWYIYPHLPQKSTIHVGKYSTIASPMTQPIPTELPGKVKVKVNMLTPRTCGTAIRFPSCVLEIGRWYHFPVTDPWDWYISPDTWMRHGFNKWFSLFLWINLDPKKVVSDRHDWKTKSQEHRWPFFKAFWEVKSLIFQPFWWIGVTLLMEEIPPQLIGSVSHYLQGFIHPK